MVSISKSNRIQMTRGDSLSAHIEIYQTVDGEHTKYVPQEGDSVRFALKHKTLNTDQTDFLDPEPLILIDIPIDTMILEILPEHTKSLGFGEYVYDIQLTMADGTVDTFIAETNFVLKPEVH